MFEFLQHYFSLYGYPIVFLSAFVESLPLLGLIFPGALLVLFGGFFAQDDGLRLVWVIFFSWFGMFLGDLTTYSLGARINNSFLMRTKFGEYVKSKKNTISSLLKRYGIILIFYSHIVGYMRSIISFIAGMSSFDSKVFTSSTFLASFFWSLMYTFLGYFLAQSVENLHDLNNKVALVGVGLLGIFVVTKILQKVIMSLFNTFISKEKN